MLRGDDLQWWRNRSAMDGFRERMRMEGREERKGWSSSSLTHASWINGSYLATIQNALSSALGTDRQIRNFLAMVWFLDPNRPRNSPLRLKKLQEDIGLMSRNALQFTQTIMGYKHLREHKLVSSLTIFFLQSSASCSSPIMHRLITNATPSPRYLTLW